MSKMGSFKCYFCLFTAAENTPNSTNTAKSLLLSPKTAEWWHVHAWEERHSMFLIWIFPWMWYLLVVPIWSEIVNPKFVGYMVVHVSFL